MTLMQLYLFTVILPNAGAFFGSSCIIFMITGILSTIIGLSAEEEDVRSSGRRLSRILLIAAFLAELLSIPFPDNKQLYTIAGGYVATNTKDISKLPGNVVEAANTWLKKQAEANEKSTTK